MTYKQIFEIYLDEVEKNLNFIVKFKPSNKDYFPSKLRDPLLYLAIIDQESDGKDRAVSNWAFGLMQITKGAIDDINRIWGDKTGMLFYMSGKQKPNKLSCFDCYAGPYAASHNMIVGICYLAYMYSLTGTLVDALRAYNVGYGTWKKGGDDGKSYAEEVLARYEQFKKLGK